MGDACWGMGRGMLASEREGEMLASEWEGEMLASEVEGVMLAKECGKGDAF